MTFKHKLSRRLALLRNVSVAGLVVLAACTLQELAGLLTRVASVLVDPTSSSVAVQQTLQLTATPQDASGAPLSGKAVTWGTSDVSIATVDSSGLVSGVAVGPATTTATREGKHANAAITVVAAPPPPPPPPGNPGAVTNLAVASVNDTSATLSFTEVTDGAGAPASYDVRYAAGTILWSSATDVTRGTCKVPMAGTTIGATRRCSVLGLAAGTAYQFQLVAFRGTLNVNAVFGLLSNVASGTTTGAPPPP